ncbi:MAG: hypothetical protein H0T73_12625 [Ardenticatenales bacterium]|nr:hypothetical protein [Ardenticatenales bacterium]
MPSLDSAPPFRAFRQGCVGCFVSLLVAAVLGACTLLLTFGGWVREAHAASEDGSLVIRLAPAIAEDAPQATTVGTFFESETSIEIVTGTIRLSASPDGAGSLVTDDRATLVVARPDGSEALWSHDFRSPDRDQVLPLPAQDVSSLFQTGTHQVRLVLEDLWPPVHSSSAYYLVLAPASIPPERRAVPVPATHAALDGAQAPAPRFLSLTPAARPAVATERNPADIPFGRLTILLIVGAATGLLLWWRRRSRRAMAPVGASLWGWLSLYDHETGEALPLVTLTAFPEGLAVGVDPLRVGHVGEMTALIEIHPGPQGEPLVVAPHQGIQSDLLRDGTRREVGRVALEFRDPLAARGGEYG